MTWIKRNLVFVVGGAVALILMGVAGFYLFSKWRLNEQAKVQLEEQYTELKRLYSARPHPGDGKVDNIKRAQEQEQQLMEFIGKTRKYFQPVRPIPASGKVSGEAFSSQLRKTIDQLQRDATNASVALPPRYYFSFQAQRDLITFVPGSLERLAMHLGEIKTISEILFNARINSLDGIRRERVSRDDEQSAQLTDYLDQKSVTNELAVLTPYEVSFRCFSPELAGVLNGFADSRHGFVIKHISVEPAAPTTAPDAQPPSYYVPPTAYYPPPGTVPTRPPIVAEEDAFAERYGIGKGAPTPYQPQPPRVYVPVTPAAPGASRGGGLKTVIDERPIKVTLLVELVKLTAP